MNSYNNHPVAVTDLTYHEPQPLLLLLLLYSCPHGLLDPHLLDGLLLEQAQVEDAAPPLYLPFPLPRLRCHCYWSK